MRTVLFASCLALAACGGVSWNTEVASTVESRAAMALFVTPGTTTETEYATRWGNPTQKIREGGQTEFVYRDMRNPPGWYYPQFGDSHDYVIVTFQYGLATGVRTSDGIDCRGAFPPRPPGPGFDNPATVRLLGGCAPPLTAEEMARQGPIKTTWDRLRAKWGEATGRPVKKAAAPAAPQTPGVVEDSYDPSGKLGHMPAQESAETATAPDCAQAVIMPEGC
jgi:hypothetical protein